MRCSHCIIGILFMSLLMAACGHGNPTLFHKLNASYTGIYFDNRIVENDSINPLDLEFLYNGGGVAVGDFNNDGRPDLYFTGSLVSNKLYLNKGGLQFTDITAAAGVTGNNEWCNGASVVDINNDGWPDIYVCATIYKDPARRVNLLYINQGLNKDSIPTFREMAREYGLADTGYSVQAAFFDYDNDGDLDMYLLRTKPTKRDATQFSSNESGDRDSIDVDKLFRNDWSETLHHPVFTDVSRQAGIKEHGYGLGVSIADLNGDGWKDIYVTNDFYGSDLLYINNHDGSFTNKAAVYLKHTSQNAMGNDIADVNNDGLPDIIAVDMDPEDNFRKKKNMGRNNYFLYQGMVSGGYLLQYVRNTLQLNMGPRSISGDTAGDPVFGEVGFYAGIAATDWSWDPAIADVDNDGLRDILITNGYPRDVTDHDFGAFRNKATPNTPRQVIIDQIPQIKISNYAFRNMGDCQFENKAPAWGLDEPSFSNGAVYVDLDGDGDLDYVVNNINDKAFVYENTLDKVSAHFIKVKFVGGAGNINGLGATVTIFYDKGHRQVWENAPVRGYLSCVEDKVLFGLGRATKVDSVIVDWGKHQIQRLVNVRADQLLKVYEKDAVPHDDVVPHNDPLFMDVTSQVGIAYVDHKPDFIDFNLQKLLLHKFSEYGPALAAGDIDGNGYDDICVGGASGIPVTFLMQQSNGAFIEKSLPPLTGPNVRAPVNMGILLFDADGDGDLDLYLTAGSDEFAAGTKNYEDRLFINDGRGNFTYIPDALPVNYTSKSCVKAADIDGDGDLDLFVGGRVLPGRYPQPVSSFIYRNDSKNGVVKFTDVTRQVAPQVADAGLICDALWTDFDNDGLPDLVLAGEWMPLTFYHNDHGRLVDITASTGVGGHTGWWNSLVAGDFDNDGDIDYIAGNTGLNSYYKADAVWPVTIYGGDLAHNGGYTSLTTLYLPDAEGRKHEYPAESRDDVLEPLSFLKKKFLSYKDFGSATIDDLLSPADLRKAYKRSVTDLRSYYVENLGQGKFALHALPWQAQLAPLYGMKVDDVDGDGHPDLVLAGNDYGAEPSVGHADAMSGLVMLGDGKGHFTPQTLQGSGFYLPGNAKALVRLRRGTDKVLIAASQHGGPLLTFLKQGHARQAPIQPGDRYAYIYFKNGSRRKEEFYYGDSFLGQSVNFIEFTDSVDHVEITDRLGRMRKL